MNRFAVAAVGFVVSTAVVICAPAFAHGGGGWSATIESQPQPYYYNAPPPVYYNAPPPTFYPQSPYPYGPPPSAFVPPPPIIQNQGPGNQWQGNQWQGNQRQGNQRQGNQWQGQQNHRRGYDDYSWREPDRHGHDSRDRWRNNDRPATGPGARDDLPKWGYGGDRRR
jgi:hypothetical protein